MKILRMLVLLPALVLLFACSESDKVSTAAGDFAPGEEQIVCEQGDGKWENGVCVQEQDEKQRRQCWQAAVVSSIYETTGKLSMTMYSHMTKGAMAVMMIAFALWLAFKMLAHVSSFTEESPAEVWTEVMRKFFLCFVCGLLATSTGGVLFVLNTIIFPLYNAFMELGGAILQSAGNSELAWARRDLGLGSLWGGPKGSIAAAQYDIICTLPGGLDKATMEGFPKGPQTMMECMICAVNERMNFGYRLAWRVILAPGFMALVLGLIMIAVFTFIKLGFVFYLVDSIFRFAMMVLMLPLLIMSFAFKATRSWTTKGFLTILNSGALMMSIAIVMFICLAGIQQILADNQNILDGDPAAFADFSVPLLMILLVVFLIVASMGVAKSIADKLVGGGGDANFQKRAAKLAASVGKFFLAKITAGLGTLLLSNSAKLRNIKGKADMFKGKMNALAGRKGGGGIGGGDDDDEEEDE